MTDFVKAGSFGIVNLSHVARVQALGTGGVRVWWSNGDTNDISRMEDAAPLVTATRDISTYHTTFRQSLLNSAHAAESAVRGLSETINADDDDTSIEDLVDLCITLSHDMGHALYPQPGKDYTTPTELCEHYLPKLNAAIEAVTS